jgi:predicted secreted Zn-dependent protease
MRLLILSAVLASLVSIDGAREATPERCPAQLEYEFYEVSGRNADEIRQSLLLNGPRDGNGTPRFAETNWAVSYSWPEDTNWSKARSVDVSVSCSARIVLPRLRPVKGISTSVIRSWQDFYDRLKAHEMNHLRNVEETAPLISERIHSALENGKKLSTFKAHTIASGVIADIRALDRSYDVRTNHGQSEGAWSL